MRIHTLVPVLMVALGGCGGEVDADGLHISAGSLTAAANATGEAVVSAGAGTIKVTICHVPPGNPANAHSITVGSPAVPARLAHGDTLGGCGGCGDGLRSAAEECEGTDLAGNDCTSLGFDSGTLSCTAHCTLDTSSCQTDPNSSNDPTNPGDPNDPTNPPGGTNNPPGGTNTDPPTSCSSCNDCGGQACVGGACGACTTNADCCTPLGCVQGICTLVF